MVTEANRAEILSLVYAKRPHTDDAKNDHVPLNLVLIQTQHCLFRATVLRDRVPPVRSYTPNLSIRCSA